MEKRKISWEQFYSDVKEFKEKSLEKSFLKQGDPNPIEPFTFEKMFGYKVFFDDMGRANPDTDTIEIV